MLDSKGADLKIGFINKLISGNSYTPDICIELYFSYMAARCDITCKNIIEKIEEKRDLLVLSLSRRRSKNWSNNIYNIYSVQIKAGRDKAKY